jgi:hypothetical protein
VVRNAVNSRRRVGMAVSGRMAVAGMDRSDHRRRCRRSGAALAADSTTTPTMQDRNPGMIGVSEAGQSITAIPATAGVPS